MVRRGSENGGKVRKRLMAYNWWWGGTCEAELGSHRPLSPEGPPMRGQTRGGKEKVTKRGARDGRGLQRKMLAAIYHFKARWRPHSNTRVGLHVEENNRWGRQRTKLRVEE